MSSSSPAATRALSPWSPLRLPVFRAVWLAAMASDVGTWMHEVGAGWLMTQLAPTPVMVALVQVATSLPIFLLSLPAGALADVVDRKRLLLFTQSWMLGAAVLLWALTLRGTTTPWMLIGLTFLLGIGAAMTRPAWHALTPDLVPRAEVPSAVALNSMGINVARATGPAVGGIVIAWAGVSATFLCNAISFLGVLIVLYSWKREPRHEVLPGERVLAAMQSGVRYVRHSPALRSVLIRAGLFIVFASALWALLPLVALQQGLGPRGYGLMMGTLGVGAVSGAAILPRLRHRWSLNRLSMTATAVFGLALPVFGQVQQFASAAALMFLFGFLWLVILSSFNTSAQMVLPAWVRARALSVYLLTFFGGLAFGSTIWGWIAEHVGIPATLILAGAGQVGSLVLARRQELRSGEGMNLAPSKHWPVPPLEQGVDGQRGPVLVTVEYTIEAGRAREFVQTMEFVRRGRRRTGAFQWELFSDASNPARFLEVFYVESWVEHLRQQDRMTITDRELEEAARAFHVGAAPPRVDHFLAQPRRRYRSVIPGS